MSGQPNPFPRPKVTIKQWMIFLAVLAVFILGAVGTDTNCSRLRIGINCGRAMT
jgi:hypothetical protein